MSRPGISIRRIAAVLSWAALIVFVSVPTTAADDPTLAEVIEKLRQWRLAIETIHLVWHEGQINKETELGPETEFDDFNYERYDFHWAQFVAMKWDLTVFRNGKPNSREMFGSDGRNQWQAKSLSAWSDPNVDVNELRLQRLGQSDAARPLNCPERFNALTGVWDSSAGMWLDQRLARGREVEFKGVKDLDGHRCIVLRLLYDRQRANFNAEASSYFREETFWLDVNRDYLPRKQEIFSGHVDWPELHHTNTWSVAEFQKIDNGNWFPKRGRYHFDSVERFDIHWRIISVTLDEPVTRADFGPPKSSPGTKIIDLDAQEREGNRRSQSESRFSFHWHWIAVFFVSTAVALGLIWTLWQRKHGERY